MNQQKKWYALKASWARVWTLEKVRGNLVGQRQHCPESRDYGGGDSTGYADVLLAYLEGEEGGIGAVRSTCLREETCRGGHHRKGRPVSVDTDERQAQRMGKRGNEETEVLKTTGRARPVGICEKRKKRFYSRVCCPPHNTPVRAIATFPPTGRRRRGGDNAPDAW